ncbi:mannosyl-oligosaccharide glucosidase [Geosmithia morbida]|uniref:Mannosyl-oligosaccharide glucosidase n=1 Tax=Geosmithia morbida TaxID=1094350 RepID=A0A9P4YPL9_9HYPO|nr:mannosyl-oligosaccharide glucosidase [Geosmithia morbida]KAF4120803.1 mannosyl-oligosaccharide glucosidase [Geosmithia morbida]
MAKLSQLLLGGTAALALSASASSGTVPSSTSILATETERLNNQSLFWGPYKPNLYFGSRPRVPNGLWTALMWGGVETYQQVPDKFRFTCEQGEIHGYGWDEYDPRVGGVQTIHDDGNHLDISTSWVKVPGGTHGGSWAVRIKGVPQEGAPADVKTNVYYYIAQEGDGVSEERQLAAVGEGGELGFDGDVSFKGRSEALGDFKVTVTKGEGRHPTTKHPLSDKLKLSGDTSVVNSMDANDNIQWQAKPVVFQKLREAAEKFQANMDPENPPPPWLVYRVPHKPGEGNVQIVQKTFLGGFEFDVIFESGSADKAITSDDVTREIKAASESFNERFSRTFDIQPPFANDEKYRTFGKSMFSNLAGGIGYFHGHQVIDRSYAEEYEEEGDRFWEEAARARASNKPTFEGPYELFTSVPSRPFFPRGFLWDEGFHLVPIADWDMDLTLEIVRSWFKTMDSDGWIPREQILGDEARTKVPSEFQVQYPIYANPPTLFLIIESFTERLRQAKAAGESAETKAGGEGDLRTAHLDHVELGEEYMSDMYPLLRRQYDWFRKTQRGEIKAYDREAYSTKEAYRWRGRTETHILTSGIDDYPRPQPPHPGELHVDLMSWVGLMTKSLMNIAKAIGRTEDVDDLERTLDAITHNLDDLHWSEDEGCYCDATIDEFEESVLVCHKGYVSLFPFLVGLMKPDDPKLGRILDLISDPDHLWSPHGIRSLSKQDAFYGTGENYWRSPVWMPINYLVLSQLKNTATQDGPHKAKARDMYNSLRKNLVDTVYKSWEETGFAWEQYNPDTGAGQRTQHFTGWTSLVVKIMAMEELGDDGDKHVRDEL